MRAQQKKSQQPQCLPSTNTQWQIHILKPKSWRFGSDDFPEFSCFCDFQVPAVNFPSCKLFEFFFGGGGGSTLSTEWAQRFPFCLLIPVIRCPKKHSSYIGWNDLRSPTQIQGFKNPANFLNKNAIKHPNCVKHERINNQKMVVVVLVTWAMFQFLRLLLSHEIHEIKVFTVVFFSY